MDVEVHHPIPDPMRSLLRTEFPADSPFMLPGMRAYIEHCQYAYIFKSRALAIHVYCEENHPCIQKIRDTVFHRCQCIVDVFKMSFKTIHFIPFSMPRIMPTKGHIRPEHINGGYTYTNGDAIFVFRNEEFPKVMLHELLHHSPMHITHWRIEELQRLRDAFRIHASSAFNPNEAIVELWAELFHILFLHIEQGIAKQTLMNEEEQWCIQQCKKILGLQQAQPGEVWSETTNSFSYIVFRCIFLVHSRAFLDIPLSHYANGRVLTDFLLKYKDATMSKIERTPTWTRDRKKLTMTWNGSD